MVVIGVIVGVVWVLLLALVVAICRAAGRADAQQERLAIVRAGETAWPETADRPPALSAGAPPSRTRRPRRVRLPTRVA